MQANAVSNNDLKLAYSTFVLGNGLIVHSHLRDSLVILNSTARLIWEMLADSRDPSTIASTLAYAFDISQEKARQDVESVFRLWNSEEFPDIQPIMVERSLSATDIRQDRQPVSRKTYLLSDVAFSIDFCSSEIESIIHAVLGHRECSSVTETSDLFEVLVDESDYCLKKNGFEVARENSPHSLRHALVYEAAKASYPDSQWLIFLHAGAVSDGKRSILMPGLPGCGKSTLTASLALEGFYYVCEDIAPITRNPWSVASVQTRICLREGGLIALKQKYPDLETVRGGRRWGRQLRYLTPPTIEKDLTRVPVHCIIFPEYTPEAALQLIPISSEEKLARLLQTGAWFSEPQDEERIKELLAWIEATPGYQIRYHNSEEAIVSIKRLIDNE
jgi:hypothetical protein